ncbi:hypothetical protein DL95DRAFT_425000 [Leptodontidium sp. 2 PMI_412]|nr:hypothetical protein DL95DRAFT_425000 [Leptodontidium sp. 2 PMI_412]
MDGWTKMSGFDRSAEYSFHKLRASHPARIPAKTDSHFDILWRRAWLTALCALGPEFTFQLALGQWSSARQSCRDFHAAGYNKWTMKHAFYADSGGFFLYKPDFKPVPIDAKQLLYLTEHKYTISVGQILWFSVTVIGRRAQGLFVSGLELTTAAFILCSFGTSFCWLTTTHTMAEILIKGGTAASGIYHRTPLDFISRDEWHWSLYWTHWINIIRKMHINFAPKSLPHDRLENTVWLDIKARGALPANILTSLLYSGIFLAGWNDHFPSHIEQILWRFASLAMMTAIALYFIITAIAYILTLKGNSSKLTSETPSRPTPAVMIVHNTAPQPNPKKRSRLSTIAARLRNNSVSKDPLLNVPLKATIPMYGVGFLYCASRTLIIVLDIIQMRSMPVSAYTTVDWGSFVPHLS